MAQEDISFERTARDDQLARKIARRARAIETEHGGKPRAMSDWWMDIVATHANGCPLDLERLSKADDFNFAHDVFGICRHLDRETGQLGGHFRPRFAAKVEAMSHGPAA